MANVVICKLSPWMVKYTCDFVREVVPDQVSVRVFRFSPVITFLLFHRRSIPDISDSSYIYFVIFPNFRISMWLEDSPRCRRQVIFKGLVRTAQ